MHLEPNIAASREANGLALRAPSSHAGMPLKAHRLEALRGVVARIETGARRRSPSFLSLGIAGLHDHLSGPGLAWGVLHEIAAAGYEDRPAAFGFTFSLMAAATQQRAGPAIFIATRCSLRNFGVPYSHGLRQLGLDTLRLVLIETRSEIEALWAIEEALRSEARPAMVAGAIDRQPDLTTSRRLNLAAERHATPLVLLRGATASGTSAATTRWRIAAAPAARDRFGALAHCRWLATLERCRNGRPGEWLIEWSHDTHCFRLVEGVADRAPSAGPVLRRTG